MFARTYGATTMGVDGCIIDVEVDSASGLPGFDIVGLHEFFRKGLASFQFCCSFSRTENLEVVFFEFIYNTFH